MDAATGYAATGLQKEILTIKELAGYMRVHPLTIYRLLRQGRLPAFRVGSNWRFCRAAIDNYMRGLPSDAPKSTATDGAR